MSPAEKGTHPAFLCIKEQTDIFVDAYFVDNGRLLFLSCVGRDTAVLQLIARLQLSSTSSYANSDALRTLSVYDPMNAQGPYSKTVYLDPEVMDRLEKTIAKVRTHSFGVLDHLFLKDPILSKIDMANRSAYLVHKKQGTRIESGQNTDAIWYLLKNLSPLPLLDSWKDELLKMADDEAWLVFYEQSNTCKGVWVTFLKLPDDFELQISTAIQSFRLSPV